MRRRAGLPPKSVGIVLLVSACTLGTDLDGFSTHMSPDAAASDGGDTRVDADVANALDSSSSDSGDGAFAETCAPPVFCDDFERDINTQGNWDGTDVTPGGSLLLDNSQSKSATRSIAASVGAGTGDRTSALRKIIPSSSLVVKLRAAYRLDPSMNGIALAIDLGSPHSAILFEIRPVGVVVSELNNDTQTASPHEIGATPPAGTWEVAEIQILRSSANARPTIVALRNGTVVYNSAAEIPLGTPNAVRAGIAYANKGPARLWIDDVRIEVH